ncbi:MAG: D-alanyl-D-alanine carboxypeptidase [Candidatus Puniceispirillum sp.]|nr:D-alanyl-D-alanine carboxypeptidase [Candidatus Pelagibacter sp.]MBA4283104.1 D-alanyl-D-alanine carboxypeptidase [Candidatus Puniceispirillum sp.]
MLDHFFVPQKNNASFFLKLLTTACIFCLPLTVVDAAPQKKTKIKVSKKIKTVVVQKKQETEQEQKKEPLISDFSDFALTENEVAAPYVYIIDSQTGSVLLSRNATAQMRPSSMTKVMTAYSVIEKIKAGQISPEDKITVTRTAYEKEGSRSFLNIGDQFKVMDLLKGMIIQSGNDASVLLAEHCAGSEQIFAKMMTEKALAMGAKHTNFVNVTGLPDDAHLTTPFDLAVITKRAIQDHPEYYSLYKEKEFTIGDVKNPQQNRNPLLSTDLNCDGVKTGFTNAAGYGLIGSCVRDGRRVIMVINGLPTSRSRAKEAYALMKWSLDSFTNVTVLKADQDIAHIPVKYGDKDFVSAAVTKDWMVTIPKIYQDKISIEKQIVSHVEAPVMPGQVLGTVTVTSPYLKSPLKIDLVAKDLIQRGNFLKKIWQDLRSFLGKK